MKIKRTIEDNVDYIVKLEKINTIWRLSITGLFFIGGYFGYIYGTEKMAEVQKQVEEYKAKLAKIPFVGKSFS